VENKIILEIAVRDVIGVVLQSEYLFPPFTLFNVVSWKRVRNKIFLEAVPAFALSK